MKGNITPEHLQETRETVGTWLKEKREAKDLTQTALALKMGIAPETVNKIEAGKWAITVDMLSLFCLHLKVPIKKLFK